MYAAGLWDITVENKPTFPSQWHKTAVCHAISPSRSGLTVALAQVQPPLIATDVYINSSSRVWSKYLTQSTILHEALHNLTGLPDAALAETLGTSVTITGATDTINKALVRNGCAGN